MFTASSQSKKQFWFWLSIVVNLGFLGFFKYYNFFVESFAEFLSSFGLQVNIWTLKIILPVGISFYTFHGMSYVIDIYKGRIKPTTNFIDYALFVSYFPLLVAGPIERATHLLPQIKKERSFNYNMAVDGLRQILWGLFKKIVIADNCAQFANSIFDNYQGHAGSTLAMGALFFAFQIYCDFSGYSDIALGTSKLFGIELLRNFAFPYFSRDIAEFWRRWHISLTTWFRDYLYIPLGGSAGGPWVKIRNTFIIFLVSGFWHGANWTFIFWGFINACYFIPLMLLNRNRINTDQVAEGKLFPSMKEMFQMGTTFSLTLIAWVFFRAENLTDAFTYLKSTFTKSFFTMPAVLPLDTLVLLFAFILIEWVQRDKQHALQIDRVKVPRVIRWSFYYAIIVIIVLFGGAQQEFIYFQF
jgi:alginate O-acetyltransferase complex protein AlgI